MNYEVKDTDWVGSPKVSTAEPTLIEQYVNVTAGIVGETYGFTKVNTVLMFFPLTMTGEEMQTSTAAQAATYVAVTYPNT